MDDELGRLNLLTPERRLNAAREIRSGEVPEAGYYNGFRAGRDVFGPGEELGRTR